MPKKGKAGSAKDVKQKTKVVEDKTFGLKNKKGKKNQQMIQQMKANAGAAQQKDAQRKKQEQLAKVEKEQKLMSDIYKPVVQQQKVPFGVDPSTVLCQFFKKGNCQKGGKCKFSHDLATERKAAKRDVFTDDRDEEKEKDTMDGWDQDKLEDVVKQKHGKVAQPQTDIICKHFLDALEKSVYGWFWVCPNGGDTCKYRHALPPGYVLKKDKKKAEEEEQITIEELIEEERAALQSDKLTPVTEESFAAWKKRKIAERRKQREKELKGKKKRLAEGQMSGVSGRDIFTLNPELAGDDDMDAVDSTGYEREKVEGEEDEADTGALPDLYVRRDDEDDDDGDDDGDGDDGAAAASADAVAVDEELFAAEDLPDDDDDDGGAAAATGFDEDLFAAEEGLDDLDLDDED